MKKFKPSQVALLVSALCAAPALWAQTAATDIGKITVQGAAGTGLIVQEETPKSRSSVTKSHIDSLTPTSSPYQVIEMLPGVSTFSQDATGLFGGGLRIRGANSDQMGFTINGAPVNDSGNFAVFPQEYSDTENLCEVFVTQGSTDSEAPHVGASGGNVGMVTCSPSDQFRVRLTQTVGDLGHFKSFVRVDTGKFANGTAKAFISYSKAQADKFKGPGKADKDHVDFGAEFKPTNSLSFSTSFLYNRAVNNNIGTLSKAQIATFGANADFTTVIPQHKAPVAGTAQVDALPPSLPNQYYGYALNPFQNYLWTAKAEFKSSKDLSFAAEPYFWYGFGNGGPSLQNLSEVPAGTKVGGGLTDLNGDGDKLDTVLIYRSSVTKTFRPGITLKTNIRIGDNNIMAGYWFERARHFQTQPGVRTDNNGNIADLWFENPDLYVRRADGTYYQGRDQLTISTAQSLFLQDSVNLMNDKVNLQLGLRQSEINRDYTNFANEGTAAGGYSSGADYKVNKTYSKLLPSIGIRYALDAESQVFANVSDNMKAPGNFSYQNLLKGGTFTNGVLTGYTQRDPVVDMETSTNLDLGYRYASDALTFSGSVFYNSFRNRIASAYDPVAGISTDTNVGGVTTQGVEIESGYKINPSWSIYGSVSLTKSTMADNLVVPGLTAGTTYAEATAGKQMPDTPESMQSIRLSYNSNTWYGNVDVKHTGPVYTTLVNDDKLDEYTTVGLTAGYRFADYGFMKKTSLQFNVSNLFNQGYLRINSSSGSQFTTRSQAIAGAPNASTPFLYVGAPRFASITLRTDF